MNSKAKLRLTITIILFIGTIITGIISANDLIKLIDITKVLNPIEVIKVVAMPLVLFILTIFSLTWFGYELMKGPKKDEL